jgi:hypothetical protein
MIDRSGAPQLATLTDEEIVNLIRVVPGLAASWARLTGADVGSLEVGKLATFRAAIARENDQLVASLAGTGLETILIALDSADSGAGEGPAELAAAAGRVFGSVAGDFVSLRDRGRKRSAGRRGRRAPCRAPERRGQAFGSRDTALRDASRRLREARNRLAHMCPLSLGEQQTVLAACQVILLNRCAARRPCACGCRATARGSLAFGPSGSSSGTVAV